MHLKPQTALRVLLHDSLTVLWDVGRNRCPRRGELPAVPDASNSINRRALLVPDRGNGSTGLLRGVPLTVNPARSSDSLSPGKDQKWDRLLNSREEVLTDRLHCIRFMKKKTANMEVIAENTLRNSYEKRLKKISNSIRFYMLFGNVAMTNCCMCRGEMKMPLKNCLKKFCAEENAPGSTRIIQKGRTITHQTRRQQYQGNTLI